MNPETLVINNQGYSVPEAAKSLGIRTNLLYRFNSFNAPLMVALKTCQRRAA
jgi:hypothetical protein